MDFKFTASSIRLMEKEAGKPFIELLGVFSMENIIRLVRFGLGINEEEALKKIDEYLNSGKDAIELYVDALKGLQDSGFLQRTINFVELKKEIAKPQGIEKLLQNSGKI